MKFRFIELKKFNKEVHELKNIIDKWTFFIKNADELEIMPNNVDDEGLKEAYEEAAQHNWSKEAYDAYIYSGIREQDDKGRIELAEKREREKERIRIIIGMNDNGVPINIIAKSVGILEKEVVQIIESQKDK